MQQSPFCYVSWVWYCKPGFRWVPKGKKINWKRSGIHFLYFSSTRMNTHSSTLKPSTRAISQKLTRWILWSGSPPSPTPRVPAGKDFYDNSYCNETESYPLLNTHMKWWNHCTEVHMGQRYGWFLFIFTSPHSPERCPVYILCNKWVCLKNISSLTLTIMYSLAFVLGLFDTFLWCNIINRV